MTETIRHIKPAEIDLRMGAELQQVAFRAWNSGLPHRSAEEIGHKFNTDYVHVVDTNKIYRQHARRRGLIAAYAEDPAKPIGFVLAANDVSGSTLSRTYKHLFRPEKIYAWLRHICVDPEYQHRGVGRGLVATVLEEFEPKKIPTAYIFEENEVALAAAAKLGLQMAPPDQEPQVIEGYFGEGFEPVRQYRFAGASVDDVIEAACP